MKKQVKSKGASRTRAIQASRLWQLSHKRHSGRVMPKRHTSYPALVMIVLCVGVFLAGWTNMVSANPTSYGVSARVPGEPPTQAATIDSPTNGDTVTEKPITVRGTCPQDTYVQLLRNGSSSGVGICDAGGKYTVQTDLFEGNNALVARVHSITDLPGPDSPVVNVNYKPVVVASSDPGTGWPAPSPVVSDSEPFQVKSEFKYEGHVTGETVSWVIDIIGGDSPYAVAVDWGDGKNDLYIRHGAGSMTLEHVYEKPGVGHKNSFTIQVTVSDNSGQTAYFQHIAIVSGPAAASGVTKRSLTERADSLPFIQSEELAMLFKYVWPSYGIVVLMLFSFWLGERHELGHIKHRHTKTRFRH